MEKLEYNIIGSGSSGNCVRIENVMIDCGLPYSKIKNDLYDTDYLLLTHRHTDHINKATFNKIRLEFPNITVIANYEVAFRYDVDIICMEGQPFTVGEYVFTPFSGEHNVLVYGYTWKCKGNDVIYATDMNNFDNAPDQKYDYLFLESNHDEHKLNAVRNAGRDYGYNIYLAAKRHCSMQKSWAYYFTHRRDKKSVYVELHKSERFY